MDAKCQPGRFVHSFFPSFFFYSISFFLSHLCFIINLFFVFHSRLLFAKSFSFFAYFSFPFSLVLFFFLLNLLFLSLSAIPPLTCQFVSFFPFKHLVKVCFAFFSLSCRSWFHRSSILYSNMHLSPPSLIWLAAILTSARAFISLSTWSLGFGSNLVAVGLWLSTWLALLAQSRLYYSNVRKISLKTDLIGISWQTSAGVNRQRVYGVFR